MCGIAGYNVSTEFYDTQFGRKTARRLASQALLGNLHRGSDAAGWMAWDTQDKFSVAKVIGPASLLVGHNNLPSKKVTALAVHTRAATTGSPEDENNNHPVMWNGVLVTHNGMIHNHRSVKTQLTGNAKKEDVPEVDSVALAMVVHEILPDPTDGDIQELANTLAKEITGSYAFSAFWEDYPGYQLLVRGSQSPVEIAMNQEDADLKFILYSSESKNLNSMMAKMGVNKHDPQVGSLKEGNLTLLKDGKFLKSTNFVPKKTSYMTRYSGYGWDDDDYGSMKEEYVISMVRSSLVPGMEQDNYGSWHWTKEEAPISVLNGVEKWDKILDLYEDNLIAKAPFPIKNALADADSVYGWLPTFNGDKKIVNQPFGWNNSTARYYGIFGNTEVVMDARGKVLDVYNWDLHEDLDDIWCELIVPTEEGGEEEDPKESTSIATKESGLSVADVVSLYPTPQITARTVLDVWKSTPPTSTTDFRGKDCIQVYPDEWIYEELSIPDQVHRSKEIKANVNLFDNTYRFMYNFICKEHLKPYISHEFPASCNETLVAARDTAASMKDVFSASFVYQLEIIYSNYDPSDYLCNHEWKTDQSRLLRRRDEEYMETKTKFPMKSKCVECKKQASITVPHHKLFAFDPWNERITA